MKKYNLEITEEQAYIISNALDLYSRVLIGQFEEVANVITWNIRKFKDIDGREISPDNMNFFKDGIEKCKEVFLNIPRHGSHGIHSPEVDDSARKSYDMHQVVRNKLAWDKKNKDPAKDDRTPDMIQVIYDEPRKTSNDSDFNLPIIKEIKCTQCQCQCQ